MAIRAQQGCLQKYEQLFSFLLLPSLQVLLTEFGCHEWSIDGPAPASAVLQIDGSSPNPAANTPQSASRNVVPPLTLLPITLLYSSQTVAALLPEHTPWFSCPQHAPYFRFTQELVISLFLSPCAPKALVALTQIGHPSCGPSLTCNCNCHITEGGMELHLVLAALFPLFTRRQLHECGSWVITAMPSRPGSCQPCERLGARAGHVHSRFLDSTHIDCPQMR